MNSKYTVPLAILLLVLVPGSMWAQDSQTEGEVEIGIWDTSVDGSPDLVLEYQPDGTGPQVKADIESVGEKGSVSYEGDIRADNDMTNNLDFDINRVFRSTNLLNGVLHRLGHQPLDHYQAATNHGRVIYETDRNPESIYEIDYQVFETWNQIQPKGMSGLTFGFGYRDQRREGLRQQTMISHCDACHVQSQDRPTDERTTDVGVDLTWTGKQGFVRANYNSRSFSDDPSAVDFTYDRTLHPETRLPVFDNRNSFDALDGPVPIDVRSDTSKDTFGLDGLWASPKGFNLAAEGVWSETTNEGTDVKSEFNGYLLALNKRFGQDRKWNFRWRGRAYDVKNTDYFVDTPERESIAGPHAGRTYRDVYGFNPDFTRLSARNRDVITSKANLTYRFNRKIGSVRLIWDYDSIDREYYEVAPGTTKTTSNELGVTWSARPARGWKTYFLLKGGNATDPFNAVNSQYSTLVSLPAPSPLAPTSAQYYEFHDARIAEGTAVPESWTRFEARGTYTGNNSSVTANYRYWDGKNNSGDLTDWSRLNQAASVTLWSAPAPKWQWYVGYTWNDSALDTVANIPLYEG
jgi:hypothetical protein